MRLYDNLHANDVWIADNHTLDIHSISSDGSTHRLYITAFIDAKSGVITGYNITENPCVQSTILALRHGIKRFGRPKAIYTDNGMEFLVYDFGGRKNRKHTDKPKPPEILKRLGIEIHTAIVKNAKAKPIERTFGTLKNQFSRLFSGFCGGTILEKPETLSRRIKNGKIPQDYEIRETLEAWIDGDFNVQMYGGSERKYKNKSRIDVWNQSIRDSAMVRIEESDLNLMLMRSTDYQKVSRNGVYVTVAGEKLWYYNAEDIYKLAGKDVYVRYDPAALSSVRIYDVEDRFLCEWQLADYMLLDYLESDKDKIADAEAAKRRVYKFVKAQAKEVSEGLSAEQRISRLDMAVRRAHRNKDNFQIIEPDNIITIKADEQTSGLQASGDSVKIGDDDVNLARMIKNSEKRLLKG
jgi:hypothetical protein